MRIDKRRELGHVGTDFEGNQIEAKTGDRINLEKRVFGIIIPWDQCFWSNVGKVVLAES